MMNGEAIQMWEQMNQTGKSTMESWLKFNAFALQSIERAVQQQFAVLGDCFDSAISHLRVLSEARDPRDLFTAQTRLATECGGKWMTNASKMVEISLQAQSELGQWMNDSFNRLSSQAGKAAEQTQQSMRQAA